PDLTLRTKPQNRYLIRLGNVVVEFSSRLQINSMLLCTRRDVRHGRFTSKRLFTFPKAHSTDVNDRKHDDYDDHSIYDFHCTPPSSRVSVNGDFQSRSTNNRTKNRANLPYVLATTYRQSAADKLREMRIRIPQPCEHA